jgi:hypothetical protein
MNIASILPRLLQLGFQPLHSRLIDRAAHVARPEELRTLPRLAVMTLENRALQLRVIRGWVWITRDGCLTDIVLGAGKVFEQRPGARVMVQSLEEAELLIAGPGAYAQNA